MRQVSNRNQMMYRVSNSISHRTSFNNEQNQRRITSCKIHRNCCISIYRKTRSMQQDDHTDWTAKAIIWLARQLTTVKEYSIVSNFMLFMAPVIWLIKDSITFYSILVLNKILKSIFSLYCHFVGSAVGRRSAFSVK